MRRNQGCVVESEIEGRQIRFFVANPGDVIQSVHYHGQFYEAEELGLMRKHWRADGTFVDIGANVGNHAVYVSRFLDSPRIVVFEPNPAAITILCLNLMLNGCSNVDRQYLGIALGASSGRLRPEELDKDNLGSTRFVPDENGSTPVIAGDDLIFPLVPSFLKIDIEGMEIEVLTGLHRTIEHWRPNIFIEIQSRNSAAFEEWRGRMGYEIVETFQRYDDISNFMLVPRAERGVTAEPAP